MNIKLSVKWVIGILLIAMICTACTGKNDHQTEATPAPMNNEQPNTDGENPDQENPIYYENKAIVLMYHHITPNEETGAMLAPDKFRSHMEMLQTEGYEVISMDQFVDFMRGTANVPANAVVITFDDGYTSFYDEAAPIMKEFGYTASHFIVGISTDEPDPEALPHLTWDEMRLLKADGMSLYSHTYDAHRFLPTEDGEAPALLARAIKPDGTVETAEEAKARITADLEKMEQRLVEELGEQDHRLLAFPFGDYSDELVAICESLGIELMFLTEEGINEPGTNLVKRVNAGAPYITTDVLKSKLEKYHE